MGNSLINRHALLHHEEEEEDASNRMLLPVFYLFLSCHYVHTMQADEPHQRHKGEVVEDDDDAKHYTSVEKLLTGKWINQLQSHLTLQATSNGTISGLYQTAVVGDPEKNTLPPPSPISGTFQATADGLLIAFNVQWKFADKTQPGQTRQSVTSWSGKLFYKKPNKWVGTWILVKDGKSDALWENVLTNQDRFKRVD